MRIHLPLSSLLLLASCASEPVAPPSREAFHELCAPYFACSCDIYWYPDVEACMTYRHAEWAELLGSAEAAGLHTDLECYIRSERPDDDRCLGATEYYKLHPDDLGSEPPNDCGQCQYVYGGQQVGEECQQLTRWASDCAQGLLCAGAGSRVGVCVDPCAPAQLNEFCDSGAANCGPDLVCDYDAEVCREFAGPGESCLDNKCAEGLWCHQYLRFCLEPVGLDEECDAVDCQAGLACMIVDTVERCRPIPQEGEHCDGVCVDDLRCEYSTHTCMRWGQPGEPCDDAALCAEGLVCADGACEVGPAEGEPCDRVCALGLECDEGVCEPERPQICIR